MADHEALVMEALSDMESAEPAGFEVTLPGDVLDDDAAAAYAMWNVQNGGC